MKKNFLKGLLVFVLLGALGCSSEEPIVKNMDIKSTLNDQSANKAVKKVIEQYGQNNYYFNSIDPILFEYNNYYELENNLQSSTKLITNYVSGQFTSYTQATDIFINTKYSSNQATIEEVIIFDSKKEEILNYLKFDPDTEMLTTASYIPGVKYLIAAIYGGCPEGYETLGYSGLDNGAEAFNTFIVTTGLKYTQQHAAPRTDVHIIQRFGLAGVTLCGQTVAW